MKKVKYVVLLIILAFLGVLIYQNQHYLLTTQSLKLNLIAWKGTLPAIQNIAYFGICLLLGLIIAGIKGLLVIFRLKKEIKEKVASISKLEKENADLKKELAPFTSDPYIQQGLEEAAQSPDPTPTQS